MIGRCKRWDRIDSDNLARYWLALSDVREKIENDILPYAEYQNLDDGEMWQTLQLAADAIRQHQYKFRIQGCKNEHTNDRD